LLPGSPALDAGQTLAWLPVDLELQPRPQGAGYDLGAFEGAALFRLLLPAVQK
jgi:hypothetical protein